MFGENIRVSSVLGFKLEMKFGLFLKTCFDKALPDRRCDLKELRLRKRRMPVMLKTDQAKTVANVEEMACLGNPDPVGMKVYAPAGEETFDDIQTTEEAQAGADRRETA